MEKKQIFVDRSASDAMKRVRVFCIVVGALCFLATLVLVIVNSSIYEKIPVMVFVSMIVVGILHFVYAAVARALTAVVKHAENRDAILEEETEFEKKEDPNDMTSVSPAWRDTTSGA